MLCFTGFSRIASGIAKFQLDNMHKRVEKMIRIEEMVDEAIDILSDEKRSILDFGVLLDEGWQIKRTLSEKITTEEIDNIYSLALDAGAIGGKILGAGGGGFLLLFARPEDQPEILERLKDYIHVPFKFDNSGSRVVLYQPRGL